MSTFKRFQFHSEDLICWAVSFQTLFNWKEGNLNKYDFQPKLYENGEQSIQFKTGFHFFAFRSKHLTEKIKRLAENHSRYFQISCLKSDFTVCEM